MLIGDDRECARAVNELLEAPEPEAQTVVAGGRQKQVVRRAFLFGHYDSRGGASLVVADEIGEAARKYACVHGLVDGPGVPVEPERKREEADMIHRLFADDYISWVEVFVCDASFPESDLDLDEEFCGPESGFRYGRIESKLKSSTGKWEKTHRMVFWKGPKPKLVVEDDGFVKYRIEREELGEDAFGLVLFQ